MRINTNGTTILAACAGHLYGGGGVKRSASTDHQFINSSGNKYAKLASLDLICDHKESFNDWMEGLETLVSSSQWLSLFPPRYENTDPTVL